MLRIKKGHPWIFWPSSICDSLPVNPGNKLLSGDKYFKLTLNYIIKDSSEDQRTLFTIVPKFTGLDLYKTKSVLTVTCEDRAEYIELNYIGIENKKTELVIEHYPELFFNLFIDNILIHKVDLKGRSFGISDSPHLILGAGNFPKNNFNLNYLDVDFLEFKLESKNEIISHHIFQEFIFDKSVDITGNCNFIHKL